MSSREETLNWWYSHEAPIVCIVGECAEPLVRDTWHCIKHLRELNSSVELTRDFTVEKLALWMRGDLHISNYPGSCPVCGDDNVYTPLVDNNLSPHWNVLCYKCGKTSVVFMNSKGDNNE